MIFGALFTFLGGSAFRLIWGEISSWIDKKLEHKQEMERMAAQEGFDQSKHSREMERLRLQTELNVKEIQVAGDMALQKTEADAFVAAMKDAMKPTGIVWVDAWNGIIRPAAASIALLLWCFALWKAGFLTGDWDKELMGAILGFYFADRSLAKRGK